MPAMTMIEAIRDAHVVAMERDDRVVVFGEDVGYFGGVFRCAMGLQERFGNHRCFDTPINESGIVGAAIGMAAYGLRPCVEIQFADYMYPAYDQLVSEAARLRYLTARDTTYIVEYYRNGPGFTEDEFSRFFDFVDSAYQQFLTTGNKTALERMAGLARAVAPAPIVRVPFLSTDVHDVDGLTTLAGLML